MWASWPSRDLNPILTGPSPIWMIDTRLFPSPATSLDPALEGHGFLARSESDSPPLAASTPTKPNTLDLGVLDSTTPENGFIRGSLGLASADPSKQVRVEALLAALSSSEILTPWISLQKVELETQPANLKLEQIMTPPSFFKHCSTGWKALLASVCLSICLQEFGDLPWPRPGSTVDTNLPFGSSLFLYQHYVSGSSRADFSTTETFPPLFGGMNIEQYCCFPWVGWFDSSSYILA